MESEKISIIVTVYNAEKYISECLESILKQTYQNIEVIIVNDGSTDNSENILRKFKQRNPNKIILINQKNQGVYNALRNGLDNVTGDYLIIIDNDDYFINNNSIELLYNSIKKNNTDLAVGNVMFFKDETNDLKNLTNYPNEVCNVDKEFDKLCYRSVLWSSKLFKKSIIDKYKINFPADRVAVDVGFYLEYLLVSKKVSYINNPVLAYRILEGSSSRTYTDKIQDVVHSYEYLVDFINKYNISSEKLDIVSIYFLRIYADQVNKLKYFTDKKLKREILKFFDCKKIELIKNISSNSTLLKKEKLFYLKQKIRIKFKAKRSNNS